MGDPDSSAGGCASPKAQTSEVGHRAENEQSRTIDEVPKDRKFDLSSFARTWPYHLALVTVVVAVLYFMFGSPTPPKSWNNMVGNFGDFNASNLPFQTVWTKNHVGFDMTSAYKRVPDRIGVKLAKKGLTAKYPIILVPGFVTSGLELWNAQECFKGAPHMHLRRLKSTVEFRLIQNRHPHVAHCCQH
jgi:hypothetical protein